MFSFEGDFRTKPTVSLGGASRREEKSSLLNRTLEERRKREEERRRQKNAVVIQSFVRGCLERGKQHEKQRLEFDTLVSHAQRGGDETVLGDAAKLVALTQRLLFFYDHRCDTTRLVWLCQTLLRQQVLYLQPLAEGRGQQCLFQLQRLLRLCCNLLMHSPDESLGLSVPLRMLEVFTSPNTYVALHKILPTSVFSGPMTDGPDLVVEHIMFYLIQKGYFKSQHHLLTRRLPPSVEHPAPPTLPLATTLLHNLVTPLSLPYMSQGLLARRHVLRLFVRDVLSLPYAEQVYGFLLPALADARSKFPFMPLLESLQAEPGLPAFSGVHPSADGPQATNATQMERPCRRGCATEPSSEETVLSVAGSPWLLHAVLTLGQRHLGGLSEVGMLLYLRVLQGLLPCLPASVSIGRSPAEGSDSEEEQDDNRDGMAVTQGEGQVSLYMVREECLRMLDGRPQTTALLGAVWRDSASEEVLTIMASLCHALMVQQRVVVPKTRLLYSLAFNARFLRHLWSLITTMSTTMITGSQVSLLQMISRGSPLQPLDSARIVPVCYLFCSLFGHFLVSVHDSEFFGDRPPSPGGGVDRSGGGADGVSDGAGSASGVGMPFSLDELVAMSACLRDACLGMIHLAYPESRPELRESYAVALQSVGSSMPAEHRLQEQRQRYTQLFKVISNLVKMLKARDTRRPFCPSNHWLSPEVSIRADRVPQLYRPAARHVWRNRRMRGIGPLYSSLDVGDEGPPLSVSEERQLAILTELPFVVPFQERVKIFQRLILSDKEESQGDSPFFVGINVTIRRPYIYEDAYDKLSPENEPDLRRRIRVHLLNAHGLDEAGIDGGGIFREFLNELLKTGFNPHQGFFRTTNQGLLYPNPEARLLVGDGFTRHYYFLGRMLGKALYENMLVELPFAGFFLSKLLGTTGDVDIHHLASLDPEVYRNLLFLKSYQGDVEELGLNFTVVNNELGEAQVVELKAGGKDIPVTSANRIAYIHLVADYRLNRQIRQHCLAFRQGLATVINLEWLRMFDEQELQVLLSGAQVPIDLQDLKNFTNYSGGYTADHPVIKVFWHVVEGFTDEQKRKLLKFVTSCSRPPLLGFKELFPAFCVHNGGADPERLPTASTCMNLLKLPEFLEEETMRGKLLYAIESAAGFELS
ncbi:ubiquitin-protein ligase E3C [Lethenteron reissneri]|uniref:ubiquitin-protein ligase E3C n=1 Tax=Lethenteron reissneri TaxID=7753 RepID=UPI002AB7A054|nr:ubiquitin-protein ligase E3C [Lethenteron reissneri]